MVLGPTLDVLLKRVSKSKEQFINLGFLNTFNRLEELYLERVFIGKRQILQLPKLRMLSIELDLTAEYEIDSRLDKLPRLVLRSKVQRLFCKGLTTYYLVIEHPECVWNPSGAAKVISKGCSRIWSDPKPSPVDMLIGKFKQIYQTIW